MEDKRRLLDIINILDSNKKVIDVGTDHGLVPLYLAKKAIIAGMGANTIIEIIEESLDFAKKLDYMILASNVNTYVLRHFLNDHGFFIEKDFLSYENKKYYDILKVYYGKDQDLAFEEYYYGFTDINSNSYLLQEKLRIDKEKNQNFLKEIKGKSQDTKAIKRIEDRLLAIRKVEKRCKFEN